MPTILLVEDDTPKKRDIVNCLLNVKGVEFEDIDFATNVVEAKQCIRDNAFDLLIVDIALPPRADKAVKASAGVDLVAEVLEREGYHVPRHIVGITAFEDSFQEARKRFSPRLLSVIRYDVGSTSWRGPLTARVKHIVASSGEPERPVARTFGCIICALEVPELEAVRRTAVQWKQVTRSGDPTIYYEGGIGKAEDKRVIAAAASRMGPVAASIMATKMIELFRPQYLLMPGITAGRKGRIQIGDVLIADPCWDWGSGKWAAEGGMSIFESAPYQVSASQLLRRQLRILGADKDLLARIRDEWPASKPASVISIRGGPLASGSAVLADELMLSKIEDQHRKLLGVDMEAYALMAAADDASLPRPEAAVFKAVCDFGDLDKSDEFQDYAAYVSARVAVELLTLLADEEN